MPTTCQITFEQNPQKVVHAGQTFRGKVQLNLAEEVNARGIYIQLYGGAYAHWRERFKFCQTHTGNEDYLMKTIYFVGGTNGEVRLSPGIYNYDFECKLPTDLPTSFEGTFGYKRYTALVVIDNKKSAEKTFRESFTVIRDVDLNNNLALRNRVIVDSRNTYRRSLWLFCWCPDTIRILARTTVSGFVPGQMINLDMIVDNHTAIPILKFTVHLIRQVTYLKSPNSKHHRIETSTINKQDARGCEIYRNKIIVANIEVPPTAPTGLTSKTSSIITIEYFIRVIGVTPCCRRNIRIDLPITIGTLPIRDNTDTQSAKLNMASSSNLNNPSTSFATNDPPIYEDEFKQRKGRGDKNKFRPKYQVFKSATSYSSRTSPQ